MASVNGREVVERILATIPAEIRYRVPRESVNEAKPTRERDAKAPQQALFEEHDDG